MEKRHLVRQTVLDAQRHLAGYELQVWEGRQGEAYTREPTPEGARLLISTIASPDLVRLVEERTVFLTFPGSFLFHDYEALLPEGRIVMVVPQPTQESGLLDAVRMRQAQGIRVGLEIDGSGPPPSPELAAQVDFLRFDLARWADPSELAAAVAPFRELGTPWVARGVHSQDAYQQCLSLGFGLFAGQFFTYPAVFSRDGLSSRQTALVEIFQKLTAGADFPDIEASFKAYPELTFQLLELLNSAAMRRKEPIYSIRQALVLLGQDNLRKWVALLLFTGGDSGRPNPLYEEAVIRGRIMELAAAGIQDSDSFTGGAFLAGIFSVIQALLMRPLRQIAKDLRLDRPIALALVEGQGVLGTLLSTVTALREERAPQAEQRIGGVTFRDRDWLVLEERASMENAVP